MRWIIGLGQVAALFFVQFSWASNPWMPRTGLARACERLLIDKKVYRPPIRAMISETAPAITLLGPHVVGIRAEGRKPIVYVHTNYGLFDLKHDRWFPEGLLQVQDWKNLKVLDLACGEGILVEDLRLRGVDAVGLDAYLTDYQLSKPYFVKGDAVDTGLPIDCCDVIISVQGPLSHELSNRDLTRDLFFEVRRLLRRGGRLLISELPIQRIEDFPPLPRGLKLKRWAKDGWLNIPSPMREDGRAHFWVEIERE